MSLSFYKDVTNQMKPSTCPTDVVFNTIGPVVQEMINSSLTLGVVPLDFKHAKVQSHLDTTVLSNYRPISKLPFSLKYYRKLCIFIFNLF